jgi:chemotaxis receptor (MCP) glutamine deamidase CheD
MKVTCSDEDVILEKGEGDSLAPFCPTVRDCDLLAYALLSAVAASDKQVEKHDMTKAQQQYLILRLDRLMEAMPSLDASIKRLKTKIGSEMLNKILEIRSRQA